MGQEGKSQVERILRERGNMNQNLINVLAQGILTIAPGTFGVGSFFVESDFSVHCKIHPDTTSE